jgi:hypothetical protein
MSDSEAKTTSNTLPTRTCYLAAPINTDLKEVEKLLLDRQIQPVVSADLSSAAMTFLRGAVDAISTVDLFIAVLSSEQSNDNVYVELGIAIAKERRILIVAPPDRPLIINIAELPTVRADITNYDAISLMLDQVLMAPLKKLRPPLPPSTVQMGRPIGAFADELEEKLDALGVQAREDEIVWLVMSALEKSGYSIVANNSFPGPNEKASRPDLVVWSDEFGPWIGNPLIIEIKSYVRGKANWSDIVEQVLTYLQLSQTRSGLVLYVSPQTLPSNIVSKFPPNIFFLSVHQLLAAMRTKSFAAIMVDLRNRRAHGIDSV